MDKITSLIGSKNFQNSRLPEYATKAWNNKELS
jgi:hypothetical protein